MCVAAATQDFQTPGSPVLRKVPSSAKANRLSQWRDSGSGDLLLPRGPHIPQRRAPQHAPEDAPWLRPSLPADGSPISNARAPCPWTRRAQSPPNTAPHWLLKKLIPGVTMGIISKAIKSQSLKLLNSGKRGPILKTLYWYGSKAPGASSKIVTLRAVPALPLSLLPSLSFVFETSRPWSWF